MGRGGRRDLLGSARRLAGARAGAAGGRLWVGVSLALTGLRLLRRMATRTPKVVFREELRPGEQLVVTHFPREGREES